MKKTSISTVSYTPGDPGGIDDFPSLVRFLREENLKLQNALNLVAAGHFDPQPAPPLKPRVGDERYADGVNWNPGSGEGKYVYKSTGAWVFLG